MSAPAGGRGGPPEGGIDRRSFLRAGLLAGVGSLTGPLLNLGRCRIGASEVSTRAVDLVQATTVVDMLGLLTMDWPRLARWQARPEAFEESDWLELRASGVGIFHPAVETGARDPHEGARRWTAGWQRLLGSRSCRLAGVATINDLLHVRETGRIGVVIGFQNSEHFRDARDVELFYRAGQRVSQLTYNARNRLGSGCYAERDDGLTPFGAEIVGEMNRVGMAIDLSHCGERTSLDAIERSSRPVLITHSNCRALVPAQPRCKSDRVIRAAAAKGGVLGLTTVRPFVGRGAPSLDDLLDHFDHVVRIAGIEHVGLGSDVDVGARDPATGRVRPFYAIRGLDPATRVFQIADGLLRRGYPADDVELVLGGNFRRALASIWPADSWWIVPERETRRDPFCPVAVAERPSSGVAG